MNACVTETGERLADYDGEDCLIYGIGNVGRQDDGLGWAFIDWLEDSGLCPHARMVRHYQLQLEDADLISDMRRVLFVDATKALEVDRVYVEAMAPRMDTSFTSHAVSIPTILATALTCFDTVPQVQLMVIRGYAWDLQIGLTDRARRNLQDAKTLFSATKVSRDD